MKFIDDIKIKLNRIFAERLHSNYKFLVKNHSIRRYIEATSDHELMLGCADGDFKISKHIQADLSKAIYRSNFGYSFKDNQILDAVNCWYKRHYGITFALENFIMAGGVINLMQNAISALTEENDQIIVQTPAYPPFFDVVNGKKRVIVENKLIYDRDKSFYSIDFDNLEKLMSQEKTTGFILCSPHNPTGRVWTKDELSKIVELACKYKVYIFSDDIWSNFILNNNKFSSLLDWEYKSDYTMVFNSPTKTYNFGAGTIGYGLSLNPNIISKCRQTLENNHLFASHNELSCIMVESAYKNSKNYAWSEQYVKVINENMNRLEKALKKHTNLKFKTPQSSYLSWIDFSDAVSCEKEMVSRLHKNLICGTKGSNFELPTDAQPKNIFCRFVMAIEAAHNRELIKRLCNEFKKPWLDEEHQDHNKSSVSAEKIKPATGKTEELKVTAENETKKVETLEAQPKENSTQKTEDLETKTEK